MEHLCSRVSSRSTLSTTTAPARSPWRALEAGAASFWPMMSRQAGGRAAPLEGQRRLPLAIYDRRCQSASPKCLQDAALREPRVQLYSDYTAQPYAGDYRDAAVPADLQSGPLGSRSSSQYDRARGVDTFVELGPGKTLCGLIQKDRPAAARTLHVEDRGRA